MRYNLITACLLAMVLCLQTQVYTSAAEVDFDDAQQGETAIEPIEEVIEDVTEETPAVPEGEEEQKEDHVQEEILSEQDLSGTETAVTVENIPEPEEKPADREEETVQDSEPAKEQTKDEVQGPAEIIETEDIIEEVQNTARDDVQQTGWQTIGGKKYFYHKDGSLARGIVKIDGTKYIFDPVTGELKTGWVVFSGVTYYADRYGRMKTGWQTIGGKKYYFNDRHVAGYREASEGKRLSGFWTIGGQRYYLITYTLEGYKESDNGVLATGWNKISGRKYYMDPETGVITTGFRTINRKRYYFSENGSQLQPSVAGWRVIDGKRYYFNKDYSIQRGLSTIGSDVYYLHSTTGVPLCGWRIINGKTYYFADEKYRSYNFSIRGKRLTGFQEIGGKKYYFITHAMSGYKSEDEASLAIGWKTINGRRYHFAIDGVMSTGWCRIGGYSYHFSQHGVMDNGWTEISSFTYHFTNGRMDKGWKTIDDKLYYFHSNGRRQECGRLLLDGKMCAFNGSAVCTSQNSTINDVVRYAASWIGKIPYKSSVTGNDPFNERMMELQAGRGSDCSWFVFHCLEQYGYLSSHVHSYEWGSKPYLYKNATDIGKDISKAKAGDIICYAYGYPRTSKNSHVGIYIGNGKQIDCANGHGVIRSSVQTGDIISIVRFN